MKYIIEFEDVPSFAEDGIAYYQCKQAPWWFSGDTLIGKLTSEQDILSEIDKIDKKVEKAYRRGLDDAWEAAKKIALMDTETSENVTGYFGLFRIMENLTPMQAIEKLKAYEEKQKADDKIEVGDEVYCKGDDESDSGVVTWVGKERVCAMWQDGSAGEVQKDEVIKTGRHFDIKSILEDMRHD